MKKIFVFAIFVLAHSFCIAAQQPVSPVAEPGNFGEYRADQNTNNAAIQSNFTELYGSVDTLTSALNGKASISCFTNSTTAAACGIDLDWLGTGVGDNLGSATAANISSLFSGTGDCLGSNGQKVACGSGTSFDQAGDYTFTGTLDFSGASVTGLSGGSMVYPSAAGVAVYGGSSAWGTSLSIGTSANNLVQLNGSAQLPAISAALLTNFPTLNQNTTGTAAGLSAQYINWADSSGGASIAGKPSTTPLTASMVTGVFPGTGDCLGANGEKVACGSGGASAIADLTDWPSGLTATELGYANGVTGSIQSQIDALSAGGVPHVSSGYPSTAGAWNFNTTDYKLYTRLASGDVYSTSAMTLAAAADVTPTGFAFTDVMTDAALSTQYTACDQVAGIDWPATVTASGGTAAICTSATYATDCGTFGTSPGTVANNGWVCARHTSSASNSTATNTVVTVGTVTDTFSTTTIAGASLSALYDARVVFADGTQIGNSFKVCAYDASSSNALVGCSSPGTVVNNSTQVAAFAGTNSLISGHNYILGVVCNGGCAISKATGGSVVYDAAGSYASPPSSFTGAWTGSGTLSVEARNSSGTNLIGSIASPTQTQTLSGNFMYGADADAY